MLKTLATIFVTAILVSAFWIFYLGMTTAPAGPSAGKPVSGSGGAVLSAGTKITLDP